MTLLKSLLAATAMVVALPAFAQDITITDAYARTSGMMAKSGAAFMVMLVWTGFTTGKIMASGSTGLALLLFRQ